MKQPVNYSLGAQNIAAFPATQQAIVKSIVNTLNDITPAVNHDPVAINATATALVTDIQAGVITSTSAAATSITLPTATALALQLNAVRGTWIDFVIDNSAGSNTVTVVVNTGITVNTPAITGGAALTVSTANSVGTFRIYFTSTTTAKIFRLA